MAKSLVIVESVAKTKTINKFLGNDYVVMSSVGHIRDLPQRRLGVDLDNNFEPEYIQIRGKEKVVRELKATASKSDRVFIATDPDREGEAIAWHLDWILKKKNNKIHRILFNEITKTAVTQAIAHPQSIETPKVEAQKARRVLDRLVGYKVSPILWNTLYKGLSAGRVQSVALRLLCEREDEIDAFKPEEYWSITVQLRGEKTEPFLSKLIKINDNKVALPDQYHAEVVANDLKKQNFIVNSIKKQQKFKRPSPPFTTSTLQQEASKRLGFTAKRTMMIAQQLYEGIELGEAGPVGLITYMRTDSTRIADEALMSVRELILRDYGMDYLPKKARMFKIKKGAQDAHEAIRPTSMRHIPKTIKKFLKPDQLRLYELIWQRFVACQMQDAELEQTTIDIVAGEKDRYLFRTSGSVVMFRGYLQVYEDMHDQSEHQQEESDYLPTNLKEGDKLTLLDIIPKQHFTKPPPRFNESSLVKELDRLGIGRPSTYATIISVIISRNYVVREGRQLVPTELGRTVNTILVQNFPSIFNVQFTAKMESELDKIESDGKEYIDVINGLYRPLSVALDRAGKNESIIRDALIKETDQKCPMCGKKTVIKWGRLGRYYACEDYPTCRFTKSADEDTAHINERCEHCGREMVVKVGRFGRFLACSGYPKCKNSKPFPIGVKCPKDGCDGDIIERKSGRGRLFYGCSKYPECDFVSWYKPVGSRCSNCGNYFVEARHSQAKGDYLRCPKCKVEYNMDMIPFEWISEEVEA